MAVFDELLSLEWPEEFIVLYGNGHRERLLRADGVNFTLPGDDPEGCGGLSANLPKTHSLNQTQCCRYVRFTDLQAVYSSDGRRLWPNTSCGESHEKLTEGRKIVLAREIDGRTERVEWIWCVDTVWIATDGQETVIGPDKWKQAWLDLEKRGFVEVFPTDRRKLAAEKNRVLGLVRKAFQGVTLGEGVGLRQGQGLDDHADDLTLASYRAQDEKHDWSAIPVADLNQCSSSLSFFDADGMRFHLPAYLVADLEGRLQTTDILFYLVYTADRSLSRFDTLSPLQREAVREFLLLRLSDPHREFEHPRIEAALRDYWSAHTEP